MADVARYLTVSKKLEEEQAIAVRELDPTAHLALKYDQLTSERSVLSLKPADRPERRNQQSQKEGAARPSWATLRDSFTRSNGRGFQHTQVFWLECRACGDAL
jgi:hypothetical protein